MNEGLTERRFRRLRINGAACAGGIALAVVLGSIAIATVPTGSGASYAEEDRLFADFSSAQLQKTNDGTSLAIYDNGGNASGLAAVDSELTHGAPTRHNAAGYLEARMGAPVTRIGAVAAFHSENSGAITLVLWSDSLVAAHDKKSPGPIPNGGVHFAADNKSWNLGVWDSAANTVQVLLHGTLAALPADGTGQGFEVVRYGDTVMVRLPDSTIQATRDPRIAQWSGPWACWELYEYDAEQVPATLMSIWAS
jgi:hypothetical protein